MRSDILESAAVILHRKHDVAANSTKIDSDSSSFAMADCVRQRLLSDPKKVRRDVAMAEVQLARPVIFATHGKYRRHAVGEILKCEAQTSCVNADWV